MFNEERCNTKLYICTSMSVHEFIFVIRRDSKTNMSVIFLT